MIRNLFLFFCLIILWGCQKDKPQQQTPWGSTLGGEVAASDSRFSLNDIVNNGEMIMLTINGPETYYDYHGHGMGLQFLMCEKFAQQLGVSLRVELCKDTAELISRLKKGDGDVIAFPLPKGQKDLLYTGPTDGTGKSQWAVKKGNQELADTLNRWFKPEMIAQMQKEETFLLSTQSITRHVYSPVLDRSKGVISHYDGHFRRYAPLVRWDWRLMAAQCYQESTFDPNAKSWAGARGLMQIMPKTADQIGLPLSDINDPERNIAAAASYLQRLDGLFQDVRSVSERQNFVLASYNGGHFHIRDAMALTKKNGGNPYRWSDVSQYVMKLSDPQFYHDPIVKYGYMRGSETVGYVNSIRVRYNQYRGVPGGSYGTDSYGIQTPRKATKNHRFRI
ncbi:MAG: transglycosylase SLT domain-containing protein [Prevotella sp.]